MSSTKIKYTLYSSLLNGRPFVTFFDEFERVDEVAIKFSSYLNSTLSYSPNSIKSYIYDVKCFLEFINESGFLSSLYGRYSLLTKVSALHVIQFFHYLKNRDLRDTTIHSCDARLRTFFSWLYSFQSTFAAKLIITFGLI